MKLSTPKRVRSLIYSIKDILREEPRNITCIFFDTKSEFLLPEGILAFLSGLDVCRVSNFASLSWPDRLENETHNEIIDRLQYHELHRERNTKFLEIFKPFVGV